MDEVNEDPTAEGFLPGELDIPEDTAAHAAPEVIATTDSPVLAETSPPTPADDASGHWLSSKMYDIIKFLAQLFLPAVATLYFALAPTWSWPRPDDVVGTIAAVDTFLGAFLSYSKGQFLAKGGTTSNTAV